MDAVTEIKYSDEFRQSVIHRTLIVFIAYLDKKNSKCFLIFFNVEKF
jgi:hypothetical protein